MLRNGRTFEGRKRATSWYEYLHLRKVMKLHNIEAKGCLFPLTFKEISISKGGGRML